MKLMQRPNEKSSASANAGTFPFSHVVSHFDSEGIVYLREGPTRLRTAFPLPDAVTERFGGDEQSKGFLLLVSTEEAVCDLMSFPLVGVLRARSELPAAVNGWNLRHRFPRAAIDDEGDVRLDMSILAVAEVTPESVAKICRFMIMGTVEFASFLAQCPGLEAAPKAAQASLGLAPGYL